MLEEVDRLTLLTTLLLELTRAEGGQAAMKCEAIDLRELVRDAAGFLGVLAEEERVRIELDLPATVVPVTGDWMMLRQAIVNLLDNAIKHSPPVRRHACQPGARVNRWKSPWRPGRHSAEHLPHVFDRFYRVDAARSRQNETVRSGFGLGLAIARWAVEAHGGHIAAESTPAKAAYSESHCLAKELSCIQKEPRHEVSRCGYRSCTHRRLRYTPADPEASVFPKILPFPAVRTMAGDGQPGAVDGSAARVDQPHGLSYAKEAACSSPIGATIRYGLLRPDGTVATWRERVRPALPTARPRLPSSTNPSPLRWNAPALSTWPTATITASARSARTVRSSRWRAAIRSASSMAT
jgi:hypothetical protein